MHVARINVITCAIVLLALYVLSSPVKAHAAYTQADRQCPPGGKVGQKCTDNTNGYTTQGHCVYIDVCHADNFPKASGGNPPPAPPNSSSTKAAAPFSYAPLAPPNNSDIVSAAFQMAQNFSPADAAADPYYIPYIKLLNYEGQKYLVTPNEILPMDAPLTPSSGATRVPAAFNTEAFKTIASLAESTMPANPKGEAPAVSRNPFAPESTFGDGAYENNGTESSRSVGKGDILKYGLLALALLILFSYLAYFLRRQKKNTASI